MTLPTTLLQIANLRPTGGNVNSELVSVIPHLSPRNPMPRDVPPGAGEGTAVGVGVGAGAHPERASTALRDERGELDRI